MILYEYPKTATLKDGTQLTIRPLRKDDQLPLYEYFARLPPEDRMYLKDDVTDAKIIENWIYDLDYDVVLPMLALDNRRIVANATLHFSPIGWTNAEKMGEIAAHNLLGANQKIQKPLQNILACGEIDVNLSWWKKF